MTENGWYRDETGKAVFPAGRGGDCDTKVYFSLSAISSRNWRTSTSRRGPLHPGFSSSEERSGAQAAPARRFQHVLLQHLLCAFNCVPLVAKELLDVENQLDVFVGVDPVAGTILGGSTEEIRTPNSEARTARGRNSADFAD